MPRVEGHRKGANRTKEIIEAAADIGIKTLTLYAFSIENWKRPHDEVITLMDLLDFYLKTEIEDLLNKGLVFKVIGNKEKLPDNIQYLVEEAERITSGNSGMNLMMAISYGGRDEIVRALRRFIEKGGDMDDVNEESFEANLDTGGVTPVDLIIRTGGEKRISNFLVWQAAYAELFFTDTLWPDFTKEEFMYAIEDYKLRQRRFGMIPDKAQT